MDDRRFGTALRAVRLRRELRQSDVGRLARVSASTVSRLERGHVGRLSIVSIRAIGSALDVGVELVPRWRGGELDRLLNARHSAMHEAVARRFATLPGWTCVPEASFSYYGERGAVDIFAWHAGRQALLVIELKTEIADVQEVVGTLDRKRRLAPVMARERGWRPASVSTWLLIADGTTNRDRVRRHATMLGNAFAVGGVSMRSWLREPAGEVAALSFLRDWHPGTTTRQGAGRRRVRRRGASRDRA